MQERIEKLQNRIALAKGMLLVENTEDKDYKNNGNVKWNFTKFLINRNGEIVTRFEPTDTKKLKHYFIRLGNHFAQKIC